jgi:hypothetical protein
MSHSFSGWIAVAGLAGLLVAGAPVRAAVDDALGFERTPPRLSFIDGEVSFFRPGAQDWAPASVNTPLAAGDELYAAEGANLELQIGSRAYVRAGEETQLALTSVEPDFLQFRVTEGHVSLDLRSVEASQTLELVTPNAVFTIERSGYYRVEVADDTTTFITRRGGRASVTLASRIAADLAASEQVVISGGDEPRLETYAPPELDAWDRWNYARTDALLDAVSARYVPYGVYGVDDLDHHGSWRVVPTYGAIWVPRSVAAGWTPYSTGRWMYEPYYGWTWVDAAPWGWAPYHYGRWVHVSGYWGWAPGPVVVRPYYAPALVAFFGGGGVSVGISFGAPHVGWVALGWGEPIVPWWGPRGVRGVPRWAGWGGPRIVNNVVVKRKTVIHVNDLHDYQNRHVRNAFVAVDRKHFGRRAVADARVASARAERFAPVHGDFDLRPGRESLVASSGAARRPTRERHERPVVATRKPRVAALAAPRSQAGSKPPNGQARKKDGDASPAPAASRVRLVDRERSKKRSETLARPPFGTRGEGERATPPKPPRYRSERSREASRQGERLARAPSTRERKEPVAPQTRAAKPSAKRKQAARFETPAPPTPQATRPRGEARDASRGERGKPARVTSGKRASAESKAPNLPGEPANRVFRQRAKRSQPRAEKAPGARGGGKASRSAGRQEGSARRS